MSTAADLLARVRELAGQPAADTIAREFEGRIAAFNRVPQAATVPQAAAKDVATPERAQLLAPVLKFPDGSGFDIEADIRVYESSATIWVEVRHGGRWVRLEWEAALAILQLRRELAAVRRALQSKCSP